MTELGTFEEEPHGLRVLIVGGANRTTVFELVWGVARELRGAGCVVEIANAVTGALPPPPDYDAIVIVASAWARWGAIAHYVEWFRESLNELPSVVALVGRRVDAASFCARALRWRPSVALSVTSARNDRDHVSRLRTATRVATEVIALHARAKLSL